MRKKSENTDKFVIYEYKTEKKANEMSGNIFFGSDLGKYRFSYDNVFSS